MRLDRVGTDKKRKDEEPIWTYTLQNRYVFWPATKDNFELIECLLQMIIHVINKRSCWMLRSDIWPFYLGDDIMSVDTKVVRSVTKKISSHSKSIFRNKSVESTGLLTSDYFNQNVNIPKSLRIFLNFLPNVRTEVCKKAFITRTIK